jgi:hypothetical protein
MSLNFLDNLANLIFVSAYWVKDILWLRLLAIVGSLVVIPYYLLQTEPLWTPMMWSCVFISIHGVRAWGIVKRASARRVHRRRAASVRQDVQCAVTAAVQTPPSDR